MSDPRYIALLARDMAARSAWEQASAAALAAAVGFEKHIAGSRLALVAAPNSPIALGREGFVLGEIYERGRAAGMATINDTDARLIVQSCGQRLIQGHWGSYVAFLASRDRDRLEVLRAPFGNLPCYYFETAYGLFVASDIDLLVCFAQFEPRVAWCHVAETLVADDLARRATCLDALSELSGGERLIHSGANWSIDAPWRIWDFTAREHRLEDPDDAVRRVRDAVKLAVAGRASRHGKILLRLSGGLDSSVVAAALASADHPFVALTLVTRDRAGDERSHARDVATRFGVPLVEAERDKGLIDVAASAARGLPRPSVRAFTQASLRLSVDAARACGATALFDGGGGDNMFAALSSLAPVADCLHRDGGTGHFWRAARSIGIATQTSTLTVARMALVRCWTRGPGYRWPVDASLLTAEARVDVRGAAAHPWLEPPPGALAGSAAHVALLVAAQSLVQGRGLRTDLPEVSPLVTQPVAEACLRVPSWLWTRDGHNRAIARDAFRALLPPSIVDRRDKGSPGGFVAELFEANYDRIRILLLDGCLIGNGVVDRVSTNAALREARGMRAHGYRRIMQLVDVEAWARSWS